MKTILVIALAGFISFSGYAQNKNCSCKKKTAYHKAVHKKTIKTATVSYNPAAYDSTNSDRYIIEREYTGNYPLNPDVNEPVSPMFRDLVVTSSAFKNFGVIPAKYTCEGSKASPPLSITNIPPETQSLAIIMYDTHATPGSGITNWMIWDIDTTGSIPENFVNDHMSMNSAKEYGYQAVCPMAGTHYYHFMVYALDTKLLGGKHTSRPTLESAMKGHILAKGELIGKYNKHLD